MASATGGRTAAIATAAVAVAGAGAFAYGSLIERNAFGVRQEFVPILAPGARPLTVLHLSDMHMAPWQTAKQNWIRSLARFEPDLVVNTGDNLGHADGLIGLERALEPFRDVPGVYVHGSNDYFGPVLKNPFRYFTGPSAIVQRSASLDTDALERYFEDNLGWLSLNNTARAMTIRGSNIEFFGTNDAHRGWDRLDKLAGAIDEMRENVGWQDDPSGPEPVTVAVTHAPYQRVLNSFVTNGAHMIFAGHTHGGQVRLPGYGALVTNCDIPHDKAQGLSTWHHARSSAYLNVSAGLGTSIFAPVRFACPPEAVIVTFTASDIGYS